jgi:hypothetical protein
MIYLSALACGGVSMKLTAAGFESSYRLTNNSIKK